MTAKFFALLALGSSFGVVTGCSADDRAAPLEVRVLAASTRVEVYTRKPGDCSVLGEFRAEPGCDSQSWKVAPTGGCIAASCVRELRLEADDQVLAQADSTRFAAFELDAAYPDGTELVIEGCGASIRLTLPAAKTDAELDFAPSAKEVEVQVTGEASGTFAAAGSYAFSQGYVAACEAEGPGATLPVSADYSFYRVSAFAFDEPERIDTDSVHAKLFPSVYRASAVSTQIELGPIWDAAVTLARQSSLFDDCDAACGAIADACDSSPDDATACSVSCVTAGEAFPACIDEQRARVACAGENPQCEAREANGSPAPCADADAAWQACAG
jgi:hypothetical protein